jgi:predicted phage tail protein
MEQHFLQGAGGGGGGGGGKGGGGGSGGQSRTPTEQDDSLQSVQYASVLDLLCEGEIQGLENGSQSIYLDGTPIEDESGKPNFKNYTVTSRYGTQSQAAIIAPGGGTQTETAVNVELLYNDPVTRTITDTDVDVVRVTINIPSLLIVEDDGDIVGNSVDLKFSVQYNGGGYTDVIAYTKIEGKTSGLYQRDYEIKLNGAFPVDIRVTRLSVDETGSKNQNRTFWSSYTEILNEKFRYPNSALVGLRFDARDFNSVPSRKYLIRGLKVRLPSNATVNTTTYPGRVTYSGVWDGTFGAATWCADPAWCLWDLLTSTRYGAGIPSSSLDKYDFYAISQYCNELVSDGGGGAEPRFSCNLLLNSRDEVYNVIQEMVSLFRGIAYYGAGSLVITQDKPVDSQYLIGPANVVDGLFTYSGTSQKSRHTTATVAYQTYESLGEVEYEYVELPDAVDKYGVINKDIKALGCYSQGQAQRAGRWALLSEQNLTETVSFSISIDSGVILRPGMVIDVADPTRSGTRRTGRISSATTTVITVDSSSNLSVNLGLSPRISVILPNGLVETKTISNISGRNVTVSSAFSQAPNAQSVWLIQTSDIQSQQFRVLNVAEAEDGIYGVTAVSYNSSIYSAVDANTKIKRRDITNLTATPSPVRNIKGSEFLYQSGQNVFTGFDLSWTSPVTNVSSFRVQYRLNSGNWITENPTAPSLRIERLKDGVLYVQIRALNNLGKSSIVATAQFTLIGKTARPADVQSLSFEAINANSGRLRWKQSTDLDVRVGGKVRIRHSNKTDGTGTWANSVDLIKAKAGNQTEAIVPLIEGEILVKFVDDGGRECLNAKSVVIDLPNTLGPLLIQSRREDADTPPFQGIKTDVFYSDEYDALMIDGSASFDSETDVDAIVNFDITGDVLAMGTYTFANPLDLGSAFSLDLSRYFITRGLYTSDLIDARLAEIDTWDDFDGAATAKVNAALYVRTTTSSPAEQFLLMEDGDFMALETDDGDSFLYTEDSTTPTWSDWKEFVNGTFSGRGFQFKAELESEAIDQNILIDQLGYEATFQRRQESSVGTVASGAGTKSVVFDKAFFVGTASLGGANTYLPSIGITAQNLATGDYFVVTNVASTGFDVTFRNSAGAAVNRNFQWSAVGYGRAV